MDAFWPGPLTILCEKKTAIPDVVTAGLPTVAVRMPSHPVARTMLQSSGLPVAAPSANSSGRPSPTTAAHVLEDMNGKIPLIIDGGMCDVGLESTVIDLCHGEPVILRPGGVTKEMISSVLHCDVKVAGSVLRPLQENETALSPGMRYKHYAPNAEMIIIEGHRDAVKNEINRLRALNEKLGNKVGIIFFEEQEFIEAAHEFFARLRDLDKQGVDLILAGALSDVNGVGFAVMNRMLKSAGYNIAKV